MGMADVAKMTKRLSEELGDKAKDAEEVTDYISKMCSGLVDRNNYEANDWEVAIVPYLVAIGLSDADAKTISGSYRAKSAAEYNAKALEEAEEEDEGEDLCNCTFSLAYGAKILLNGTKMNLKRGKVYGIVGTNGVGKSTLMRAIDNGQVTASRRSPSSAPSSSSPTFRPTRRPWTSSRSASRTRPLWSLASHARRSSRSCTRLASWPTTRSAPRRSMVSSPASPVAGA